MFFFFDENFNEPSVNSGNKSSSYTEAVFEDIKHINEYGQEFWYARDLQTALEYEKWSNFKKVIEKAVINCKASNIEVSEHFAEVGKTLPMPNNASKTIIDYELSRYACYY